MAKTWGNITPPKSDWSGGSSWGKRKTSPTFETPSAKYARRILSGVMTEIEHDDYVPKLRVSSLPICGLLDAIGRITRPKYKRPYRMDFYTAQGTAIHETIQNRWVNSPRYGRMVFANWKCLNPNCGEVHKLQMRPDPFECKTCGGKLKYEELDFVYKRVSGHLDLLTRDKRGRWIAWEFKTTGEYSIQNPTKYLPVAKHHYQIQTYCMMLKRLHDIDVHSYMIVYINRNKTQDENKPDDDEQFLPFPFRFTQDMLALREEQLERIRRSDVVIKKLLAKPNAVNLRKLESLRPCRSLADYKNPVSGMSESFFGKEECPFYPKGLCFKNRDGNTEAGMTIAALLDIE